MQIAYKSEQHVYRQKDESDVNKVSISILYFRRAYAGRAVRMLRFTSRAFDAGPDKQTPNYMYCCAPSPTKHNHIIPDINSPNLSRYHIAFLYKQISS